MDSAAFDSYGYEGLGYVPPCDCGEDTCALIEPCHRHSGYPCPICDAQGWHERDDDDDV